MISFLFLILFGFLVGTSTGQKCNIKVEVFWSVGELKGNNAAFFFVRDDEGNWEGVYSKNKENSYGLPLDSLVVANFLKKNENNYTVKKRFKLNNFQRDYLINMLVYFRELKLSENVYSNSPDYYYVTINGKVFFIPDRGKEVKKIQEMLRIFKVK